MHNCAKPLHMNLLIQLLINNTVCVVNQSPNNNLRIMLPINNNSTTYTSLIDESESTGNTYMLPFNNKSTDDVICASLLISSLIYKSLIILLTKLLTKLLLFLLLINQAKELASNLSALQI